MSSLAGGARFSPPPVAPARPLVGVTSGLLTSAVRRVEARWRERVGPDEDPTLVARLLAAIALAVERRCPEFLTGLTTPTVQPLSRQLIDLLRAELLHVWSLTRVATSPLQALQLLTTLEELQHLLDGDRAGWLLRSQLTGPRAPEFLTGVLHDLRSPLNSILFLAETLQHGWSGDVNELQHRQLGLIYGAALGLTSLVSDALELARGTIGLAEGLRAPFSVTALLESIHGIVRPLEVEKGLEIRLVPPAGDRRFGYPVALSRVLLNLTTNALKFTDRGFVEVIATARGPASVEFAVRDTGPGVAPGALPDLFQPLRPTQGDRPAFLSSTGLGLAICRRLVSAMDSELRLETRPDWGTRFFFEIDLPPADDVPPSSPA